MAPLRHLFCSLISILPTVLTFSPTENRLEPYQFLSASLTHTFPESTHHHPAYSSVIVLLDSLSTAPSCHRTTTTEFISDCNNLSASSTANNAMELKMHYAVRLAVCEFEASGIQFPGECSRFGSSGGGGREKKRVQACLKKLETRPQWWTSLSNNLQNAVVICAAVRNEVEEDRLLDLYRNVTKAQENLFEAMDTSLQRVWGQLHEQREWAAGWKGMMAKVHGDVETAGQDASNIVRNVGKELAGLLYKLMADSSDSRKRQTAELEELENTVHRLRVSTEEIAHNVEKSAIDTQDTLTSLAEKGRAELHSMMETGHQQSFQLHSTLSTALGTLHQKISDIVIDLDAAYMAAKELSTFGEALSNSYVDLSAAQDAIWKSLREQQAAQLQLHEAFEKTMERMLTSAERFERYVELAEERVKTVGKGNQVWVAWVIIVVGLGVLWGADLGKLVAGTCAIVGGVTMLLRSPEVLRAFGVVNVFFETDEAGNFTSALTYRLPSSPDINFDKPFWKDTLFSVVLFLVFVMMFGMMIHRKYNRPRKVLRNVVEKTNQLPTHN